MTRSVADLDVSKGRSCTIQGLHGSIRATEDASGCRLIDRIWNPCEPMEPHVVVVAEGVHVGVALVGPVGPPVFIDPAASPLEMARAIYSFAQDFRDYAKHEYGQSEHGPVSALDQELKEVNERVEELETEVAKAEEAATEYREAIAALIESIIMVEDKLAKMDPKMPALIELRQHRQVAEKRNCT